MATWMALVEDDEHEHEAAATGRQTRAKERESRESVTLSRGTSSFKSNCWLASELAGRQRQREQPVGIHSFIRMALQGGLGSGWDEQQA